MITALCRTVILYFLIMIGLRLMGKRQIGELEPSELVLTMMISDLATVPMQDFGIPLLAGVIPILILLSLTLLMSQLSLLNLRFRALMCGTPAILIRNGKLQQAAMRKNRYTLDELLEQLRGQGCLSVEEVQYAVLENSGQLSVLPWAKAKPPTAEDLGLTLEEDSLPTVLINDGRVLRNNLRLCGRDEVWLQKILKQEHCTAKEISRLRGLKENIISVNVNKLVAEGYLEREGDANDRRKVHLKCTGKADAIIQRGRQLQEDFLREMQQGLSAQELRVHYHCLETIAANAKRLLAHKA